MSTLSAEIKRRIDADGFAVIPGVLSHHEMDPESWCRVVNAVRIVLDGIPFAAWEHRDFAGSATTVATASLIENWIDW
jgi:hypothetical protein